MENGGVFLKRLTKSLADQTFQDFELVVTEQGKMAENTNRAIKRAKGDIIKLLYMDDYLFHETALANLSDNFVGGWLASGCVHDDGHATGNPHLPTYELGKSEKINTIGSPSVVAFENKDPLLFDENLSWMLDVELYGRLYKRYGMPTLLNSLDIVIGLHGGQMTNIISDAEKGAEERYLDTKLRI